MTPTRDSTRDPSGGKPSILSRDRDGNEHRLGVVDHPHGLISLFDATFIRIMAPDQAIALGVRLIAATKGHFPADAGPLSGSF